MIVIGRRATYAIAWRKTFWVGETRLVWEAGKRPSDKSKRSRRGVFGIDVSAGSSSWHVVVSLQAEGGSLASNASIVSTPADLTPVESIV